MFKIKYTELKKWYNQKFPHIPFVVVFLLIISVVVIIITEFLITDSLSGIGLNIATEIIGILYQDTITSIAK